MANLALFDFDGTITTQDMFTFFLYYAVPPKQVKKISILFAPVIVGYRLRLISATMIRQILAKAAFGGRSVAELSHLGEQFAASVIPKSLRPEMMERVAWHRNQGDDVVIVSASLSLYLKPWAILHNLDLICAELEEHDGFLSGRYLNSDCAGDEKANRVRERYELSKYANIFAYGDTKEDLELLKLANKKFYRGREIS